MARAYGCSVYGMDLSPHCIKNAEMLGIQTINREEIKHLRFDFINSEQVLEHIPNPLHSLKKLTTCI